MSEKIVFSNIFKCLFFQKMFSQKNCSVSAEEVFNTKCKQAEIKRVLNWKIDGFWNLITTLLKTSACLKNSDTLFDSNFSVKHPYLATSINQEKKRLTKEGYENCWMPGFALCIFCQPFHPLFLHINQIFKKGSNCNLVISIKRYQSKSNQRLWKPVTNIYYNLRIRQENCT